MHGKFQAFWSELVLTTFFVSVILSAKYLNGAADLFLNALTIGLTLFTCVTVGGGVSGGCFNPAVGLVQIPFQIYADFTGVSSSKTWAIYWIYPIACSLGGAIAGIFLKIN